MLSDEALARLSLQQGSHYFGELVKRHSDYLFGFGMRLTAGNTELAKDLSQQSFLRAFRYLQNFDDRYQSNNSPSSSNRFRNWLTGIAVNCLNDLIATENRYQQLDQDVELMGVTEDSPLQGFYDLIRQLRTQERLIIVLRYVYEYKVEEIAEIMNMKSGTIKSKISRALKMLREVENDKI